MTSISQFETKADLLATLRGLSRFAFPHWVLWALVLITFAVNSLWLVLNTRISIEPQWFAVNSMLCAFAFSGAMLRYLKPTMFDWFLHRLWMLLLCALMSAVLTRNLQVLNHLIMTTNFPMADDLLMHWDRALGFDWLAYSKFMTVKPAFTRYIFFAYNEVTFSGLSVLAVFHVLLNRRTRAVEIFFLSTVTALICILAAAPFPARATMDLLADQELLSRLKIGTGVLHVQQLMELRGSMPVYLQSDDMQGLVSFPSFHTCMALIIAWCSRGRWYTLAIGCVVAVSIIIGTPIFGGHYLVDVLGGAGVMCLSLWLWRKKIEPMVADPALDNSFKFALPAWLYRFALTPR